MLIVPIWALAVLSTSPTLAITSTPSSNPPAARRAPVDTEDELRRARNEYAYGNYEEAVQRLTDLLYPMQLSTDAQVIEARKYLALSYYLLDRPDAMEEEFIKLLYIDPDHQLDPFSVAPSVIDRFESLRKKLTPELDVIRQRKTEARLNSPHPRGIVRTITTTVIERSDILTLVPFGVGQFQNGDVGWGITFAVTELLLLGANVGAYLWAVKLGDYPVAQRGTVQALTITQYASLGLFGLVWSLGVFHARLHFVPTVISAPEITDLPPSQAQLLGPNAAPPGAAAAIATAVVPQVQLSVRF